MNDTYLSVDLDYWKQKDFPAEFFHSLFRSGFPIRVVNHHQQLLAHIDVLHCHNLVNIDWHSDLGDGLADNPNDPYIGMPLNCGTWVNFVKKPQHFVWYYPSPLSLSNMSNGGYCHVRQNPFTVENPKEVCGWESATKVHGMPTRWDAGVNGIGIAISHYWGGAVHWKAFRALWKTYASKDVAKFKLSEQMDDRLWRRPFVR